MCIIILYVVIIIQQIYQLETYTILELHLPMRSKVANINMYLYFMRNTFVQVATKQPIVHSSVTYLIRSLAISIHYYKLCEPEQIWMCYISPQV